MDCWEALAVANHPDIFGTGIGSSFVDIQQPETQPPKQSLLDKIFGNLGSPETQFALRLLEQGGPQPFPVSFGQGIGRAGLDTFQGQQKNRLSETLNDFRLAVIIAKRTCQTVITNINRIIHQRTTIL